MVRHILFVALSLAFLTWAPETHAAQPNPSVIEAQGAPAWQGAPGYGQEWEGRREHCWRMRDRLREIRYRMESAPPWERDRLSSRFYEIRERLRHECWGHWRED